MGNDQSKKMGNSFYIYFLGSVCTLSILSETRPQETGNESNETANENQVLENNSVDVVISNCVINLAPDKLKVFKEAHRVLKSDGRIYVSDIVLLGELDEEKKTDKNLLSGCVAGALLKEDYLKLMGEAGFKVSILSEDKEISKKQYEGINLESLKVEGRK